eukprot:Sspe_Gene.118230::Locus_111082_Transcript_1_1_Confidence_1.000_Length_1370::g.118230::m.118230/K07407/E3.2.1.22B, galA, rafA; alpha-galactosidase
MLGLAMVLLCVLAADAAGPYGLATTPPMGWRSWNAFGLDVTQELLERVMDKMVEKRPVHGEESNMSLADLGYVHVGLDDGWQECGAGVGGSFHDEWGNPIVDRVRFPNMKAMTDYAHARGLKPGWYMNNCHCMERGIGDKDLVDRIYRNSTRALVDFGFDGVKLDSCSQFHNMSYWVSLMVSSGRSVMVENCYNTANPSDPRETYPFNMYRISTDIKHNWPRIMGNLEMTLGYAANGTSKPGCWAYPDMLEVGNLHGLYNMDRSHFALWAVVSSPLILGYNVTDDAVTERIWDIISNREIIDINRRWAGHPGTRLMTSDNNMELWGKPIDPSGAWAVVVVHNDLNATLTHSASIPFATFAFRCPVKVRDVYAHTDLGSYPPGVNFTTPPLGGTDSRMYTLTPSC